MNRTAIAATVALVLAVAPIVGATQHAENSTGETNEFGSIRAPYQLEITGRPLIMEAHVRLESYYDDQKATFFMFAWDTKASPQVTARFLALETADGTALPVAETKNEAGVEQWFVDVENMPEPGSVIIMRAEVGASSKGFFSVGAMVMAFTYKWDEVKMTDGEPAKLYAFTQLGVNKETGGDGGGPRFGPPAGGKLPVPAAAPALLAAVLVAAAIVLPRRR